MRRTLSFLLMVLIFPAASLAEDKATELDCSCVQTSWKEAFDKANHVVFGEVKSIKKHGDDLATGDFIPIEVFKGSETHITKIVGSGKSGVSCRRVLHAGFFIAYGGDSHTVVLNNCASSRQLREEENLVATLSALKNYAELKNPIYKAQHSGVEKVGSDQSVSGEDKDWWQMFVDWYDSW